MPNFAFHTTEPSEQADSDPDVSADPLTALSTSLTRHAVDAYSAAARREWRNLEERHKTGETGDDARGG
jgi:hypothetical protein